MLDATSPRDRRGRLFVIGWGIALAAALVVGPLASVAVAADPDPTPTPTETPSPTPSPSSSSTAVTYRLNLLRSGDFTRQYTRYQCVGASLQTMRNIIWSQNNRGKALQKKLWNIARSNSLYRADGGADPFGWTTTTALAGYGRYVLVASSTMAGAIKAAAKGMALTRRPAGLVVWRGTHAWVMTGFHATADPRVTEDFKVVRIRMADPLWPTYAVRAHRVYRPGTRLSMSTLKKHFTPYHDARRDDRVEGRYVAIVPVPDGDPLPANAWAPTVGASSTSTSTPTPGPTPNPTPLPTPTPTPAALPTPSAGTSTSTTSEPSPSPTEAPTPTPSEAPTPSAEPSSGP